MRRSALHPGTLAPVGPSDLAPLFPPALIMQEVSTEREIEIPEPVRAVYRQWRPSPLYRARRLEAAANTNPRLNTPLIALEVGSKEIGVDSRAESAHLVVRGSCWRGFLPRL
jgi:predicted alternative tryptophan synthase beta-subunit